MSDRERWDERYRRWNGELSPEDEVLRSNAHLLPQSGHALELACGLGQNALWLAHRGLDVHAWDVSGVAIEHLQSVSHQRGLTITAKRRDILQKPPEPSSWDVIVITRFLDRSITESIAAALRPGGLLFYQTFTRTQIGSAGPKNSAYRLADGELLSLFPTLRPIAYREEGLLGDTDKGSRSQAMLVATPTTADA